MRRKSASPALLFAAFAALALLAVAVPLTCRRPPPPRSSAELAEALAAVIPGSRVIPAGGETFYVTTRPEDTRLTLDTLARAEDQEWAWHDRLAIVRAGSEIRTETLGEGSFLYAPPWLLFGDPDLLAKAADLLGQ